MNLGRKIILAFGVPVLFTVITGVMSVVRMHALNDTVQSLATDSLHGTEAVGRLAGVAKDVRGAIRGHITATTADDKLQEEKDLAQLKIVLKKEQSIYQATIRDTTERELFNAVPGALHKLVESAESILPLSRAGKSDQAMAMFHSETMPLYLHAQRTIENLTRFKELDGNRRASLASSSVASRRSGSEPAG